MLSFHLQRMADRPKRHVSDVSAESDKILLPSCGSAVSFDTKAPQDLTSSVWKGLVFLAVFADFGSDRVALSAVTFFFQRYTCDLQFEGCRVHKMRFAVPLDFCCLDTSRFVFLLDVFKMFHA